MLRELLAHPTPFSPTMKDSTPCRRSFLVGSVAFFGGCLGGSSSSNRTITDETDGYPPQFDSQPKSRSIDTSSFKQITVDGTAVPLAPIDVASYWYRRHEARFVDARGERSYEQSHILGAVLSPAPDGGQSDPVELWPKGDRIVCYCGCPHHLSSIRAANLLQNGYEEVYVIDEGFWEWHDRGYPMAGQEITTQPAVHQINGVVAPQYAGETVWAWHEPSGQREAAPIMDNGRYLLEIRFTDVTPTSMILVETPTYRVRAPLGDLIDGTITEGDGSSAVKG